MNPSTTALTLNLQLPNIATVSWAVQGDQLSRVITATLLDGSTAWNPQAAYHGVMRYHKPDGTSGVYDVDEDGNPAVTWSGNVATIKIVQQALTVPGSVMMQLEFYDANSARVSAFGWINNVQPSAVTDNEFLSADYYNILSLQIAAVLGAETHPPYIDGTTHDWMVWDTTVNDYVDSGVYAIGPVGPPPTVTATGNQYANSASGTTPPSSWSDTRPAPVQGQWSWTKTTVVFDTGTSTFYTAAYQGIDGGGNPGTATPLMDGTAAVGTSSQWAHEDHVHPSDTSKVSKAGDTMTGELTVQNSAISEKSTTADTTDDAPSETTYWDTKHTDKNNRVAAYWETSYSTSGTSRTTLRARRNVNGSNVNNGFALEVDKNGERSVSFDEPAAWRDALGLAATSFTPTRNTTNTDNGNAYGIYDPGTNTVRIYGRASKTGGIPLSSQMFSVPSAYRPSATKYGICVVNYSDGFGVGGIEVKANGDITQTFSSSSTVLFFIIEYTL